MPSEMFVMGPQLFVLGRRANVFCPRRWKNMCEVGRVQDMFDELVRLEGETATLLSTTWWRVRYRRSCQGGRGVHGLLLLVVLLGIRKADLMSFGKFDV